MCISVLYRVFLSRTIIRRVNYLQVTVPQGITGAGSLSQDQNYNRRCHLGHRHIIFLIPLQPSHELTAGLLFLSVVLCDTTKIGHNSFIEGQDNLCAVDWKCAQVVSL